MSKTKPTLPKGTRDFGPLESARRQYVIQTIRKLFLAYGFAQIETPTMENLSVLTGKYGDEGDKLIFRVLNSGDFLSKVPESLHSHASQLMPYITEKGLRYDLTVPFARYVAAHQHALTFPFKRFQIQPVYRADRPQKSRYREFYQCDADIIGSRSIWSEVELTLLVHDVFKALRLEDFSFRVNHRQILAGLAEYVGLKDNLMAFSVELDKLDKVGIDNVVAALVTAGAQAPRVKEVLDFVQEQHPLDTALSILAEKFQCHHLEDVKAYFSQISDFEERSLQVSLDLSLARGLTYYTGMVFEVKPTSVAIGSISGGGRYDDLTGIFGLDDVSGVGISFGLDRIYDVLHQLDLFPLNVSSRPRVLLAHFNDATLRAASQMAMRFRDAGLATEIYPEPAKLKKQLNYADKTDIPFVLIVGEDELAQGRFQLKDMKNGNSQELSEVEIQDFILNG